MKVLRMKLGFSAPTSDVKIVILCTRVFLVVRNLYNEKDRLSFRFFPRSCFYLTLSKSVSGRRGRDCSGASQLYWVIYHPLTLNCTLSFAAKEAKNHKQPQKGTSGLTRVHQQSWRIWIRIWFGRDDTDGPSIICRVSSQIIRCQVTAANMKRAVKHYSY